MMCGSSTILLGETRREAVDWIYGQCNGPILALSGAEQNKSCQTEQLDFWVLVDKLLVGAILSVSPLAGPPAKRDYIFDCRSKGLSAV